jgi:hypothetical protein
VTDSTQHCGGCGRTCPDECTCAFTAAGTGYLVQCTADGAPNGTCSGPGGSCPSGYWCVELQCRRCCGNTCDPEFYPFEV